MTTTQDSASLRYSTTQEDRWRAARERATRGLLLFNSGPDFAHLEGDVWAVRAAEGGWYKVDLEREVCDCPDFEHFGSMHDVACKHLNALAIAHDTRRSRRLHACNGGWVSMTVETDDGETEEVLYLCRRCSDV